MLIKFCCYCFWSSDIQMHIILWNNLVNHCKFFRLDQSVCVCAMQTQDHTSTRAFTQLSKCSVFVRSLYTDYAALCQFVNRKTRMLMCLRLQTCAVQFPQINFVFCCCCLFVCSMNEMSAYSWTKQVHYCHSYVYTLIQMIMCAIRFQVPWKWIGLKIQTTWIHTFLFCFVLLKYICQHVRDRYCVDHIGTKLNTKSTT